jgi:FkbM family methyltransferase
MNPITHELLAARATEHGEDARSQLHQDAFVLEVLGHKKNGYFVDIGAASGVALSNTYLLEKKFGWRGILVEPARGFYDSLYRNRVSHVCAKAAWRESGQMLQFMEPQDSYLSSLACRAVGDGFEEARFNPTTATYDVVTVSLLDLLVGLGAPTNIDYLSLDTEGSECDVLEPFDFTKYVFKIITCEHNHNQERRQKVYEVLTGNGYRRVHENLSIFEDWYLHESVKSEEGSCPR